MRGPARDDLRDLGFDTWYRDHAPDRELAERAATEKRVLLTRDRGLLKRTIVRFGLSGAALPFGRCLRCNTVLEEIDPALVADRLPLRVRREQHEFRHCPGFDGLSWTGSGSLYARMRRLVEAAMTGSGSPS